MPDRSTSIRSHGTIETTPAEIYGSGPVVLRIGNGGAGATGLLAALSHAYLSQRPGAPASIAWIRNHSRNTQLALLHDHIDLALTYERAHEALAVREGWAASHGAVFHDHFCLAGPVADPAALARVQSVADAVRVVAHTRAPWVSRADGSATMARERAIWDGVGLRPWEEEEEEEQDGGVRGWYRMRRVGPAEAVVEADRAGAYLLTDRSTLLKMVAEGRVERTTVFFEPGAEGDGLMNSCFAMTRAEGAGKEGARFLAFLKGSDGQRVVEGFGIGGAGRPFFAGLEEGWARVGLKGGRPSGGKWVGGSGGGGRGKGPPVTA